MQLTAIAVLCVGWMCVQLIILASFLHKYALRLDVASLLIELATSISATLCVLFARREGTTTSGWQATAALGLFALLPVAIYFLAIHDPVRRRVSATIHLTGFLVAASCVPLVLETVPRELGLSLITYAVGGVAVLWALGLGLGVATVGGVVWAMGVIVFGLGTHLVLDWLRVTGDVLIIAGALWLAWEAQRRVSRTNAGTDSGSADPGSQGPAHH